MFHDVARQGFGQRFAFRFSPWPGRCFRLRSGGPSLRLVFFQIAQDRLQSIDRLFQLLRRRSEALS